MAQQRPRRRDAEDALHLDVYDCVSDGHRQWLIWHKSSTKNFLMTVVDGKTGRSKKKRVVTTHVMMYNDGYLARNHFTKAARLPHRLTRSAMRNIWDLIQNSTRYLKIYAVVRKRLLTFSSDGLVGSTWYSAVPYEDGSWSSDHKKGARPIIMLSDSHDFRALFVKITSTEPGTRKWQLKVPPGTPRSVAGYVDCMDTWGDEVPPNVEEMREHTFPRQFVLQILSELQKRFGV